MAYWRKRDDLQKHFDTFDEQLKEYLDDEPSYHRRAARDGFGRIFTRTGHELSQNLTKAEEAMKETRVEAKNVGVEDPNAWDQESGFLSAVG